MRAQSTLTRVLNKNVDITCKLMLMDKEVRYVLLDWSGTIGIPTTRNHFTRTGSHRDLYPGVVDMLRKLKREGYGIGILSNTSTSKEDMVRGLKKAKLTHLFDVGVYSSEELRWGCGQKPCSDIFEEGWRRVRRRHPSIHRKSEVLYVGDQYLMDVCGAKNFGFHAALVADDSDDAGGWRYRLAEMAGIQDVLVGKITDLEQYLL